MTGRAAAQDAGPAVIISFGIAGLGCAFAALCYAEFAAMAPVAGSAYTYAYTTLGEIFAWIIGWDLILEYAMGCATVASAWSGYLNKFLLVIDPRLQIPRQLLSDPFTPVEGLDGPSVVQSPLAVDHGPGHDHPRSWASARCADQRPAGHDQGRRRGLRHRRRLRLRAAGATGRSSR